MESLSITSWAMTAIRRTGAETAAKIRRASHAHHIQYGVRK